MPALHDYAGEGVLTLNSMSMNTPAWAVIGDERGQGGLLQLVTASAKRGEDRILPSANGVIAYPRELTVLQLDFHMLVTGDVSSTGTPNSNSATGLATNLGLIWDGIVDPAAAGVDATTGTVTASYVGLGLSLSGVAHVIGLDQDEYGLGQHNGVSHQSLWIGTLTLSFPAGRLT